MEWFDIGMWYELWLLFDCRLQICMDLFSVKLICVLSFSVKCYLFTSLQRLLEVQIDCDSKVHIYIFPLNESATGIPSIHIKHMLINPEAL